MITENGQKIDVVLISPPIISDLTYKKSHYICSLRPLNVHPPLALSCLAEYLKKHVPSLATEILDGEIEGNNIIKGSFVSDVAFQRGIFCARKISITDLMDKNLSCNL